MEDELIKYVSKELNNNYNIGLVPKYGKCNIDIVKINEASIIFEFSFDKNNNLLLYLEFIPPNYYDSDYGDDSDDREYDEEEHETNKNFFDKILEPLNYMKIDHNYIGSKCIGFVDAVECSEDFIHRIEKIIIKEISNIFTYLDEFNNNTNQLAIFVENNIKKYKKCKVVFNENIINI